MIIKRLKTIIPTVVASILLLTGCIVYQADSSADGHIFDSQYSNNVPAGVIIDEGSGHEDKVEEEIKECTISEFLNSGTHYFFAVNDEIKKDGLVIYILKTYGDGTCISSNVSEYGYLLGDLTKLSDEELDEVMNDYFNQQYQDMEEWYDRNWEYDFSDAIEISMGLYKNPHKYQLVAKTDASGNNIAKESMYVPQMDVWHEWDEVDKSLTHYFISGWNEVRFSYYKDCQIYDDNLTTFLVCGTPTWGSFLCVKNNEGIKLILDTEDCDELLIDPKDEDLNLVFPKTIIYSLNERTTSNMYGCNVWYQTY